MKKKLSTFCLFFILNISVFAQLQPIYTTLKWETNPKIHSENPLHKDSPAVIILDKRITQVLKGYNIYSSYHTIHKIVRVNNDAGIEMYNRVYIPMYGGASLKQLEVRCILPNGEIKALQKENLKELKNVEGYGDYKIFAVEGLVKNGELEYVYTIKRGARTQGREIFQSEVPTLLCKYELHFPKAIDYKTKSYNGFPEGQKTNRKVTFSFGNIPGLNKEDLSSHQSKLMRVDYSAKTTTWDNLANNLYTNINATSGASGAKRLLKENDLINKTKEEKIKGVEKVFKSKIKITKGNLEVYQNPKMVFKNKVGNELGILRAYVKCLRAINVDFDIVYTTSRFRGKIDPTFSHSMDLHTVAFYIPSLKKYLFPTISYARLGYPPIYFGGNTGFYLKARRYSDNSYYKAGHYFNDLPSSGSNDNHTGVNANITINTDEVTAYIDHQNFYKGHRARLYRYFANTVPEDKKTSFVRDMILTGMEESTLTNYSFKSLDLNNSFEKDSIFYINGEYNSKELIKKAGNDYLFSIGKLIGTQNEMYEEKDRQTDIILSGQIKYNHTLTLNIPTGYECKGLESVVIENRITNNGKDIMYFSSNYEILDNQLIVTAEEVYSTLIVKKEAFDDYRKVVNSAANFNKATIILQQIK